MAVTWSVFISVISFWTGTEGLLRLFQGKQGALVVMSMGYGIFFVTAYYMFLSHVWPKLLKEHKDDKPSLIRMVAGGLFAASIIGIAMFTLSFLQVQGVWKRLG